ncbi:MAG: protein-(glutamine-N5) methyltransferase, release factor-specific, partial [Marinobacterium sp.]
IRLIASQARAYLKPGGWLLFEHGYDQGEAVRQCLMELGYVAVATVQDLGGNDRVTQGCWQETGDDE